jgi:hypothetical protein
MCRELCEKFNCYNTKTHESGFCDEHDPETIREERLNKLENIWILYINI